jgi:hypothetical protein
MATALTTTAGQVAFDAPAWNSQWAQQAACRGLELDYFFEDLQPGSRRGDPYAKARQICDSCPSDVKRACLATSIAEGLRSGFFGGAIPARRIELRKAAQKAMVDVNVAADIAVFLASR